MHEKVGLKAFQSSNTVAQINRRLLKERLSLFFLFKGVAGTCTGTQTLLSTVELTTEYKEWQWLLSGVHSIMMVKSAQPGDGFGCTPSPFHSIYHHELSCGVRSS
jgi:hypothetical protein